MMRERGARSEACSLIAIKQPGGEGGIRTLGTLLGYGALAKRCFRPLSHLTKISLRRQYCSIEQRLLELPERGREYGG
jgi:hypothetical protein